MRVKGLTNILFGGQGMYMDRFVTTNSPGLLILHGYGNVFERRLKAGESIMVEPGAFLYKDSSVTMDVEFQQLGTGLLRRNEHEPGAHDRAGAHRHSIDVRASPHGVGRDACSAQIVAAQVPDTANFCAACWRSRSSGAPAPAPAAPACSAPSASGCMMPPPVLSRRAALPGAAAGSAVLHDGQCPWCGAEISAAQLSCPRCGATLEAPQDPQ